MSELLAALKPDQATLLAVVSEPYILHERWPTFAYVSSEMRKRRLDARELLSQLPRTRPPSRVMGSGYGLVKYEPFYQADSEVWLTVAGQSHIPELSSRCRSFVLAVQDLRRLLLAQPSSPFELVAVYAHSADMSNGKVGKFSPPFVRVLFDMLLHEPVTFVDGSEAAADRSSWKMLLSQTLLDFHDVTTVPEYVARVTELTGGAAGPEPQPVVDVAPSQQASTAYVLSETINRLRELQTGLIAERYRPDKLIQLLEELDGCFRLKYAFASHALLRAVMDHVPPVFGCKSFDQVASNLSCSATDKKYLRVLLTFKNQADDVMHRMIGRRPNVLSLDDMPPRAAVNALIGMVVDVLDTATP
jgi:hypothetical protein